MALRLTLARRIPAPTTPTDLRATAARLATMTQTGAWIPKDQVGLYAEALKALAEKREREGK